MLVDDCSSDDSYAIASKFPFRVISNRRQMGPAAARNIGIRASGAAIIAFTDSDCAADADFLECIEKGFADHSDVGVLAGNTKIPPSTFLGNCISELGFPGGANAGFERIWHVSTEGYTNHISSCNFAVRREVIDKCGMFDERFTFPGGEDSEYSYRISRMGIKILYCPRMIVWHEPRNDLASFVRWQLLRGRTNYHFRKRVGKVSGFVALRLWSSINIVRKNIGRPRVFVILMLLALSVSLQQVGYLQEATAPRLDRA